MGTALIPKGSFHQGVLVGCDQIQEWLLPWWWENYRQENTLPVAFADFGMSDTARTWCAERGLLQPPLSVDGYKVATKEEVDPRLAKKWDKSYPFWSSRNAWFKKPFAILRSPFFQSLWIDLDCEILDNLEPLYSYIDPESKIGLVRTHAPEQFGGMIRYNSGVIATEKDSPILKKWGEAALSQNHLFLGDEDTLCHIIFEGGHKVGEVPEIYNWRMCKGIPIGAKVLHWMAKWGKDYIKTYGGLRNTLRHHSLK